MGEPEQFIGFSSSLAKMPFIISSSEEKADPATRKLIRSHVMRGKKKKVVRPQNGKRKTGGGRVGGTQITRVRMEEVIDMYTPQIPGRVGSDLSFIEFSGELEPSMRLNMIKVSPFAKRIVFPLIMAIGFQADNDNEWISLLRLDAAALHITAFAVESFIDRVLRRQEKSINLAATLHFQDGMKILRERLLGDNDESKVSDSTIGVVLKLASAAYFNGDHKVSRQHMDGIRRMVDLRGGPDFFRGKHLWVEIMRCDLSNALLNGSTPLFFSQPSEPAMDYPARLLSSSNDDLCSQHDKDLIGSMDSGLATAWRVMKRFCLLINLGTQTQRFVSQDMIHQTMSAVIYRLLRMRFAALSLDETVRHGLLGFTHHVFLQWQDIKLPYQHFSTAYRKCMMHFKPIDEGSSQLMLWLLMTGALSVFDVSDETWLEESLREHAVKCKVDTWKEMEDIFKSYMWIPLLDEQPGKQIYGLLNPDKGKRTTKDIQSIE